MKLAILSCGPRSYSTRRLREAAAQRGCEVKVLNTLKFAIDLQRGEPDIYVNPDDAAERGIEDGDLIRIYNDFGNFVAMAHVSSMMQPRQLFMYHGWDPVMFRERKNFSSVMSTNGLIKPVQMIGDYGHMRYQPPDFVPNQTFHDCTVEFEKYSEV